MQTLNDLRALHLLTQEQHQDIGAWIAMSSSPEEIMQMPPHLWRALALASKLSSVDAELSQPPQFDAEPGCP